MGNIFTLYTIWKKDGLFNKLMILEYPEQDIRLLAGYNKCFHAVILAKWGVTKYWIAKLSASHLMIHSNRSTVNAIH